jgi:hypothetical protein
MYIYVYLYVYLYIYIYIYDRTERGQRGYEVATNGSDVVHDGSRRPRTASVRFVEGVEDDESPVGVRKGRREKVLCINIYTCIYIHVYINIYMKSPLLG